MPLQLSVKPCPCHEPLLRNMSRQQRQNMFHRQFQASRSSCPAQGMMLPELVTGALDKIVTSSLNLSLTEIVTMPLPAKVVPPSESDMRDVVAAAHQGQACLLGVLHVKTAFLKTNPWMLAGLAVMDEDVARVAAAEACKLFDSCPVREEQHRVTWRLLNHDATFRKDIDKFVTGVTLRMNLPEQTLRTIASFRFVFSAESKIEGKHAAVTLASHRAGKSGLSACEVSLANRLPLLQQWLRSGHCTGEELLDSFSQARDLRTVAASLGVHCHPCKESQQRWRQTLPLVLYNVALESKFQDLRLQAQHHDKHMQVPNLMHHILSSSQSCCDMYLKPAQSSKPNISEHFPNSQLLACASIRRCQSLGQGVRLPTQVFRLCKGLSRWWATLPLESAKANAYWH